MSSSYPTYHGEQPGFSQPSYRLEDLAQAWPALFIEGLLMASMGALTLVLSPNVDLPFFGWMGWLLLFAALVQLFRCFMARNLPGFLPGLASAVFFLVLSVVVLSYPHEGILSVRFLITAYFLIDGVANSIFASKFGEFRHSNGAGFCGLLAICLGLVCLSGWPGKAEWLYGLMLGCQFLLEGFVFIAIAMGLKDRYHSDKEALEFLEAKERKKRESANHLPTEQETQNPEQTSEPKEANHNH